MCKTSDNQRASSWKKLEVYTVCVVHIKCIPLPINKQMRNASVALNNVTVESINDRTNWNYWEREKNGPKEMNPNQKTFTKKVPKTWTSCKSSGIEFVYRGKEKKRCSNQLADIVIAAVKYVTHFLIWKTIRKKRSCGARTFNFSLLLLLFVSFPFANINQWYVTSNVVSIKTPWSSEKWTDLVKLD